MPQVAFKSDNKLVESSKYPTLKLAFEEKARIACLEAPAYEWVHTLRAPMVVDGQPVMKMVERRGEQVPEYSMDFIGTPICLGDDGIIRDKGIDPKNCPVCAEAAKSDVVSPPQRKFAMHVLRYSTKPGSYELSSPFQVTTLVWRFNDKTFSTLSDLSEEWQTEGEEAGGLQTHDLMIKCTQAMYQNYEFGVASIAEWARSKERQAHSIAAFNDNKAKDISALCGRKTEAHWMEKDLQKIRDRWALLRGGEETVPGQGKQDSGLMDGLDSLLSDAKAKVSAIDLLDVPNVTAPAPKPGSSGEELDFSSLLSSLE